MSDVKMGDSISTSGVCLTVVDYGCGSGILAVSAARLGARRVYAVDHDLQALQATRDNADQNGVSETIEVLEPLDVLKREKELVSDVSDLSRSHALPPFSNS